MEHIIVAGAGQAGSTLAETLRSEGFAGRLTLVGAEPVPPYQRPPLSKGYLLGDVSRERLFLRPGDFYAEHDIDLRLGQPACDIDTVARTLRIGDETLRYDALALTTGLEPRNLPEDMGGSLGNVYSVRTLADVDAMARPLAEARHVLVIGGGYIGLEAAAVARKLGIEVTLVEAGQRILGRVAAPETSDYFRTLHAANGVEIREALALDHLTGKNGKVCGAALGDGTEIACDAAIVGIGLVPRCAIAEAAGIDTDGGVAVDEFGRSSDPHVWAAGDCAALPFRGGRIRLESVQNAIDMAEAVARNMLGAETPYRPVPWFWSDQYDVKLQIAGMNTGYERIVLREGDKPGSTSHWYFAGDRLLAVDAMNDGRAYMVGKRLLEAGRSPDPDAVADPERDLKALLRA